MNKIKYPKVWLESVKLERRSIVDFCLLRELGLVTIGLILYLILVFVFDHQDQSGIMTGFVVVFAVIKTVYILKFTLRRTEEHLSHALASFYRCLSSLGSILILIILSFSLDYYCLTDCNSLSFSGISDGLSILERFSELMYFSIVTFATIGFGDIVPSTLGAKFLVVLEIGTSFIMVVFIISNFHNMHYSIVRQNGAISEHAKYDSGIN